ncbi:ABC transporter ATP-binding protein, partial [Alicyclobacillaceae bacterium I2511]
MPILTLENLHKRLGRRDVIRGLTMTVEPGEVYGFVGPNGAGKTTTIRMIVGLIRPSAGRVTIGGFDVQHQRSHALAQVGAIVENPETYSYLSGRQNLMQYARLAGVADAGLRIDEVTEQVRLKDRIDDKVKNYSLGMRQRLGVAQALLARPKLLVLDEPTNGLDPAGMREFRQLMRDLADQGMAVFVSSHLLGELEQVCDRIGVIQQGELIVEEGMAALKARSGNTIVVDLSPTSAGKGADLG